MFEKPQTNTEDRPNKVEKISESSPEYEMDRIVTKDTINSDYDFEYLGDIELTRIKSIKEKSMPVEDRLNMLPPDFRGQEYRDLYEYQKQKIDQIGAEKLIHECIIKNLDFFNELLLKTRHIKVTEEILHEAINNPDIRTKIKEESLKIQINYKTFEKITEIIKIRKETLFGPTQKTKKRLSNDFFSDLLMTPEESLIILIYTKKISDQLWIDILENHKSIFLKKSSEFKENILPGLIKEFQDTINTAIDQKELPLDKELVKKRTELLSIGLIDELFASLERIGGSFNAETNILNVSPSVISFSSKVKVKHVFFHEMFHALSGRIIVQDTEDGTIRHERIGLDFDFKRGDLKIERFLWLNEALTTYLEGKFLSIAEKKHLEPWSYKQEREIFKLIMTEGKEPIDEKLFINAYFKNLDPNLPSKDRLPAWEALTKQISLSWKQGFLTIIDNLIKEKGIKETIRIVRGGGF